MAGHTPGQFVAKYGQVIGILEQQADADMGQLAFVAGLGDWQPVAIKTTAAKAANTERRLIGFFIGLRG
ncbi:MAG TPA: hypothetical protein VMA13_00340 [Candidatus Saccharimonadales bacterium]|nr:hypothetical protein [Candidatus Saccharimonadales bacterium]